MAIRITMSLARRNQEPKPSNITYFYDNSDIVRFGLHERYTSDNGGVGIGLLMQRIVDAKKVDFIKIIDPVITHRLQRAFYQKKKFRKMSLQISENVQYTTMYSIRFEDIRVTSLRQQFESYIIMDIVSIEADYVELG